MPFKKGQISPRKGKKHTEESKKKMSMNNSHFWLGKKRGKMSEEHKRKVSESKKGQLMGDSSPTKRPEVRLKISAALKGRKHTKEENLKNSKGHKGKIPWNKGKKMPQTSGEKNYRWMEDRSLLKRKDERNDSAYQWFVRKVKKLDGGNCRIANDDCKGTCIVHHILRWEDYPELRYNINNGITLCHFHHPRKKEEEHKWAPIFKSLVESRPYNVQESKSIN